MKNNMKNYIKEKCKDIINIRYEGILIKKELKLIEKELKGQIDGHRYLSLIERKGILEYLYWNNNCFIKRVKEGEIYE